MTSPSRGDGFDGRDGCAFEQPGGVDPVVPVDGGDRACGRLVKADGATGDRGRVEPGKPFQCHAEQGHVEATQGITTRRQVRREGMAPGAEAGAAGAGPQAEPALAATGQPDRVERLDQLRPGGDRFDVEQLVGPAEQLGCTVVTDRPDEPVGREDGQRLGVGFEEQGQQVIERRVLLARTGHPALVAVAQRRLVAVMPVGDGHRSGGRRGDQGGREIGPRSFAVGRDGPQSMAHAVVVGDLEVRGRRGHAAQPPGGCRQPDRRTGRRPGSC